MMVEAGGSPGSFALGDSRHRLRVSETNSDLVPLPRAFRDTVMAIANTPVAIARPGGQRVTVSLFEMLVRRLAAGQTSRRISPMPFIALVIACASTDEAVSARSDQADAHDIDAISLDGREPLDARLVSESDADVEDAVAHLLRMTRDGGPTRSPLILYAEALCQTPKIAVFILVKRSPKFRGRAGLQARVIRLQHRLYDACN